MYWMRVFLLLLGSERTVDQSSADRGVEYKSVGITRIAEARYLDNIASANKPQVRNSGRLVVANSARSTVNTVGIEPITSSSHVTVRSKVSGVNVQKRCGVDVVETTDLNRIGLHDYCRRTQEGVYRSRSEVAY